MNAQAAMGQTRAPMATRTAQASSTAGVSAMAALEAALNAERAALRTQDVEALLRATEAKLVAIRQLERDPPAAAAHELTRLSDLNRANGAMLARQRRLVQWSLRALGRHGSASDYDRAGQTRVRSDMRALAVY